MKKYLIWLILLTFSIQLSAQQQWDTTWASLRSRPYPQWFKDAKLGIFIHWGVYSVPSVASKEGYAEWYLKGVMSGDTGRINYMKRYYGTLFGYFDFAPLFKAELFKPDDWAELFRRSGAKYIILTSKHHDGYCLWPSKYARNWNSVDNGPKRDIVGELKAAVEKKGITFGLYYSLPEWSNPLHRWTVDNDRDIGPYVEQHMIPQFKELISAYKPKVLFTDGEWNNTAEEWHARQLIAWYFNTVGDEAIVNDRWGAGSDIGFRTPEYSSGIKASDRPWAECRGLGRSFGLNRNETLEAYMTPSDLIHFFVKAVANGGGITLNVGPGADGQIPLLQQERLIQLGDWIKVNEEAIYGSTPYSKTEETKEAELKRVDPQVNFDWVRNSPGKPISEDDFTAAWTGYIEPAHTEAYTFEGEADDGFRLWIDNRLILDHWVTDNNGSQSNAQDRKKPDAANGKIMLKAGQKYVIKVEYIEKKQNASITLWWSSPALPKEVIPQSALFTDKNQSAAHGLNAVYKSQYSWLCYTVNHGNLYAIALDWPGRELSLQLPRPKAGSNIQLLGYSKPLPWKYENGKIVVDLRGIGYNDMPCQYAWTFKISGLQ